MNKIEQRITDILTKGSSDVLKLISKGFHKVRALALPHTDNKEVIAINYKTELESGVRLEPTFHFTNDGLIDKTIYSYEGDPVLQVEELYEYNAEDLANTDMNLSKKGLHSRTKTWRYFLEDGTLDTSDTKGTFKTKTKYYRTDIQGLVVGRRRRHNIQIILSERAGALLVILGVFSGAKEVKDAMRKLSKKYSIDFQEYQKYGTEDVIEDISLDTAFPWMDTYVPTDTDLDNMVAGGVITVEQKMQMQGAFAYYDLTNVQGMTVREYVVEKLKGNIK